MVNRESRFKTPAQSPEDRHIYCILLFRIAFCHVSKKLPLSCLFYDNMNIYVFYFKTARDVVTVLLIFAKYLSLYLHIFTYKGTHTQAHMYHQHTRGMATTRHRSLAERGGRKALLEILHTKKKCQKKTDVHESKEKIRAHRASSKATSSYDAINATSINLGNRTRDSAVTFLFNYDCIKT